MNGRIRHVSIERTMYWVLSDCDWFLILIMRSRKLLQEYDVNRSVILAHP